MCTVSYIPLSKGYLLTTNRDEDPSRESLLPQTRLIPGGRQILAPFDASKGGTWIAADYEGRAACTLNGALKNHTRKPPYRRSRGLLILDAFGAPDFDTYLREADPSGMEPFSILLVEPGRIQRWVWDGRHTHFFEPDPGEIHLWSSSTLYTREEHAAKEAWFRSVLRQEGSNRETLLKIHGNEGPTPFILDRPEVRTVSITQIVLEDGLIDLTYNQIEDNETARITLPTA